jgi:hypothetical protein
VQLQLNQTVVDNQNYLNEQLSCQSTANGFYDFKYGLCTQTQQVVDGLWSTYTILAFWSLLSLPIVVFLANRFFAKKSLYKIYAKNDVEINPSSNIVQTATIN